MAVTRPLLLVVVLFLLCLSASVGVAGNLVAFPQVAGPQTRPVMQPNELAWGAPLYVFLSVLEVPATQWTIARS